MADEDLGRGSGRRGCSWIVAQSGALGLGMPGVLVDESGLPTAAQHGLEPLSIMDLSKGPAAFPFAQGLAVDASDRSRIGLCEIKPCEKVGSLVEYEVVPTVVGEFAWPHPEDWWRDAHEQHKSVLLMTGQLLRYSRDWGAVTAGFFRHPRCARVPLLLKMWPTGLGTRSQEPRDYD